MPFPGLTGGKIAAGDRCPEPTVALDSGAELRFFEGCAPAWKPNETLTFVQGGGVVALLPLPPEGGEGPLRVVFSRRDFLRQMRAARPRFLGPFMLEEIAWVTDTRLVAIVRFARRFNTLAVFEEGKLVARPEPCCPPVSYLRALPGGRVFAGSRTSTGRSLLLFDRLGRFVTNTSIPAFLADGRAFTESPDGRWTASTLPDSIQIYRSNVARPLDPVDLPLRVVDLGWASR